MQGALVYRGMDDIGNLRIMRVVLEAVRANGFGPLRVGPFDDALVAEGGVVIEGSWTVLEKVKRSVNQQLADRMLPAVVEELDIVESMVTEKAGG